MEARGSREYSSIKPLRSSIVRLKYYKKAVAGENEAKIKRYGNIYKHLYLLALTPDALQLYTTKDAGDAGDDHAPDLHSPTLTRTLKKLVVDPVKSVTARRSPPLPPAPAGASSSRDVKGSAGSQAGSVDAAAQDLEEDQVFTISVSLNQVVSVSQQDGNCLKVAFRPNKPNRKRAEEEAVTALKAMLFPLWYPVDAVRRDDYSVNTFMERHVRKDPMVHTFLIACQDEEEATSLKRSIEAAIERLWRALQWLSKDLPLLEGTSISMVSMDCPACQPAVHTVPAVPAVAPAAAGNSGTGPAGGLADQGIGEAAAGGAAAARGSAGALEGGDGSTGTPPQQPAQQQQRQQQGGGGQWEQLVVATHPSFGDKVPLPDAVSACIARGRAGSAAEGAPGEAGSCIATLHVWMHTSLGPAEAQLVPSELLRNKEVAAGCPFTLRAVPSRADSSGRVKRPLQGRETQLEVLLRCSLVRGDPLPESEELPAVAVASKATPRAPGGEGWLGAWLEQASDEQRIFALALAGILLVLLLNWAQMAWWGGRGAVATLAAVSFMVCSLVSIPLIAFLGLRLRPGGAGSGAAVPALSASSAGSERKGYAGRQAAYPQGQLCPTLYRWYLELIESDLVEMRAAEGSAPPLVQTLSVTSGSKPPPEGEEGEAAAAAAVPVTKLPMPIQRLMEQHPSLVNANVAERFLIGWGTPTQAYTGLLAMVDWMQQQRLENAALQPQPKFELIKRHYRHGVFGRSKTDCPVEIECMGGWKAAYEAMLKEGVSEEELLRHLVFIYDYTFTRVDARPLPHGKTVKIVDLDGLCMADLRTEAVKFLTKVGGLLNQNYPQRLHRCFLVNAPTWWAVAWRLISPMIAKETREQMFLFGKKDQEGMQRAILQEVAPDQLPQQYGGTSSMDLYDSQFERQLLEHVQRVNASSAAAEAEAEAEGVPAAAQEA